MRKKMEDCNDFATPLGGNCMDPSNYKHTKYKYTIDARQVSTIYSEGQVFIHYELSNGHHICIHSTEKILDDVIQDKQKVIFTRNKEQEEKKEEKGIPGYFFWLCTVVIAVGLTILAIK